MKEVELKFQVPPGRRAALAQAVAGRTDRQGMRQRTRLRAAYWDMPDRALAQALLALRVRREGRVWVQTLKGVGNDGMTRLEHNVPLPPDAASAVPPADPALHAGTPVGERLLAVLAKQAPGAALQLQYRTDVLRLGRSVKSRLGRVELALDEGRIEAADRRLPLYELEIELKSGSPLAVIAAARRWLPRFGLWLDTRSKAERGDLLSRGETAAPARLAQPVALTREMSPAQARLEVLRSCADQVCRNASQVASGTHASEHVHQLRVGLRRLRCALALFGAGEHDTALAAAAASMFRRLGAARDQAVLQSAVVNDIEAALRSAGADSGVPVPSPSPVAEAATDVVRSPASQALLLDLLAAVVETPRDDVPDRTLPRLFKRRLKAWYRRAAADALRYAELDDEGRHRLRKQVKRLRYAVEFGSALFEPRRVRRFVLPLRALQDRLGALADVAMATDAYRAALPADPRSWFALGWLAARRDALVDQSIAELEAFARAKRFWTRN